MLSGSRTGPAPTAEVGTAVERRDATAGSRAVARGGGATAGGDDSPEVLLAASGGSGGGCGGGERGERDEEDVDIEDEKI